MTSALAREYRAELAGLRRESIRAVEQAWSELPAISQSQMDRWLQMVLPVVQGGRQAAVGLTDGYMADYLRAMGEQADPMGLDPDEFRRPNTTDSEVYARPFTHTYTKQSEGMDPRRARQFGGTIATTLVNTDVQLAGRGAANRWTSTDRRIQGYRRVAGPGACKFCTLVATRKYTRDDLLPIHDNCVPAGVGVAGPEVQLGTRRWYEGRLVSITTASGYEVSVTPNHPVLTVQGWVPADFLTEGDEVIRCPASERVTGSGPHEHQRPSLIEDVWQSLRVADLVRMPLTAEDFHGDGIAGEVDVVGSDGFLADVRDRALVKKAHERGFVPRRIARVALTGQRTLAAFGQAACATTDRVVCGLHAPLALAGIEGLHVDGGRVADTPPFDAGLVEPSGNGLSGDTEARREVDGGQSGQVGVGDLLGRQRGGIDGRFDAPSVEFTAQGREAYASTGRRLLDRLSGVVERDAVIETRRIDFAGHVYNLQTAEGWYASNTIVTSNCGCTVEPIVGGRDPGISVDFKERAQRADPGQFAVNQRQRELMREGKWSEARSVGAENVVEQAHGELGPVLREAGHNFTGPDDI